MTLDLGAGKGMHVPGKPGKPSARIKLSEQFAEDFRQSESHYQSWRTAAKKYYQAYAGDPWSPGDKEHMKETGRPPVSFNLSLGTINAVIGSDQGDRKEIRFEGVSTDVYDTAVAEWLTNLARHQFNRCNGHRVDSDVFLDGLITGMGFSECYFDTHRFPFQMKTRRLPVWQVYPDPGSREPNFQDARFFLIKEEWTYEEIKAKWPKFYRRIGALFREPEGSAEFPRTVHANSYQSSSSDTFNPYDRPRRVQIFQYQYKQIETWVAYTDEAGRDQTLSLTDFRQARQEGLPQVEYITYPRERYYRAYIAGRHEGESHVVLENAPLPIDSYSISSYTGFQDVDFSKGRVTRFGLMHVIYEPQMWSAKVLSQIVEILARGSKGFILAEKGAFADPEQAKTDLSTPGAIVTTEDEALSGEKPMVQFHKPAPYPAAMSSLLDLCQGAVPHVSGVTDWLKGTANQERSNVLISNLQSQSLTMLSPALDPLAGYRIQQGLVFTQLAVKYLSAEKITRILGNPEVPGITVEQDPMTGRAVKDEQGNAVPIQGPDGEPLAAGVILKDSDIFELDVQVDTGQASPTARQAFWRMWVDTALLQQLIEAGVPVNLILPELLKFSPLPAEMTKPLVTKLEAELEQGKLEQAVQLMQGMSPEELEQLGQALMQIMQGQQGAQGGGAPAPQPPPS